MTQMSDKCLLCKYWKTQISGQTQIIWVRWDLWGGQLTKLSPIFVSGTKVYYPLAQNNLNIKRGILSLMFVRKLITLLGSEEEDHLFLAKGPQPLSGPKAAKALCRAASRYWYCKKVDYREDISEWFPKLDLLLCRCMLIIVTFSCLYIDDTMRN